MNTLSVKAHTFAYPSPSQLPVPRCEAPYPIPLAILWPIPSPLLPPPTRRRTPLSPVVQPFTPPLPVTGVD